MSQTNAEINQLWMAENGETGLRIACQTELQASAGQYLLASVIHHPQVLPTTLFPISIYKNEIVIAPPVPPDWQVGTRLALRGPLGIGFVLPRTAKKIALAALTTNPYRLLALVQSALAQAAEIAFFTSIIPTGLSPAVEIPPVDQLPEALRWADYLAVDLQANQASQLAHLLGIPVRGICPCPAQALLHMDMPCGGKGHCGICSILTRRGWRLACEDGPVFELNELLEK